MSCDDRTPFNFCTFRGGGSRSLPHPTPERFYPVSFAEIRNVDKIKSIGTHILGAPPIFLLRSRYNLSIEGDRIFDTSAGDIMTRFQLQNLFL